ncbi:hypothetical protein M758_8G031300 [Ceratodon purpureus]|nr:hypothetical protein M758_8G031300 [Ceratodon purpureus]
MRRWGMDLQTERNKALEADCVRRTAQVKEELEEAKKCLEMVNKGGAMANQWPYGPRGPCCFEAAAKGRTCRCRAEKEPGRKNRYNLNSLEPWNCGNPPEPEFLADHVHCYHPRLPRPGLYPKITFGAVNREGRPISGGSCQGGQFGDPGGPRLSSGYHCPVDGPRDRSKNPVLPNESRYGFYRYYGYAGQGAKTSKGYRPKIS